MMTRVAKRLRHWPGLVGLALALLLFKPEMLPSQVRAGAAYLKIQPSVRSQGMAGTLGAAIDEVQAFYANPAAAGFFREWQWSVAYTRWVADIYSLSANIGGQVRVPWSNRFGVALGLSYQGVRPFDSTKGGQAPVSASDMLAVLSVGNPLSVFSRHLAVGANLKYLRSDLMGHTAGTYMADVGVLCRTRRVRLAGPFEHALLSAGIAAEHLGPALPFQTERTPLPRTLRAGVALNMGTHSGLQLQLAADYHWVRDEVGRLCLGAELAWGYRLALRTGYEFNEQLLSKFSAGMSLRLDDRAPVAGTVLSGNNRALRLDIGGLEANELFEVASRAGMHHYPICPERFDLLQPQPHDTLRSENVALRWEGARDPDLFDEVRYLLLVERATGVPVEQSELARLLAVLANRDIDLKDAVAAFRQSFCVACDSAFAEKSPAFRLGALPTGDYLWTVVAYDRDGHWRVAHQRTWPFHVVAPDIQVVDIRFEPDIWITESDTQGVVSVEVRNNGPWPAPQVVLTVTAARLAPSHLADTLWQGSVRELPAQGSQAAAFTWLAHDPGLCHFQALARLLDARGVPVAESDTLNNRASAAFYTIPKGTLTIPDTVQAFVLPLISWQVPLVTKVFFDFQSAEVPREYYQASDWFYAPLETLARRVIARPEVVLRLEGFCDAVNGEQLALAQRRALAVRQLLLELGVPPEQVPSDSVHWAASPDKKVTLNAGVHQERRNVRVKALRRGSGLAEVEVIAPVPFRNLHEPPIPLPVHFANSVKGVVPVQGGTLVLRGDGLRDSLAVGYAKSQGDSVRWSLGVGDTLWLHRAASYTLQLSDTLGRRFLTRDRRVFLVPKGCDLPIVAGLAEFNDPRPFPIVPWEGLLRELETRLRHSPNLHFRFVGHACGITPRSINNTFSRVRATNLQEDFLRAAQQIGEREPALCRLVLSRLDREGAVGKSADEPFTIALAEERFLLEYKELDPVAFGKLLALQRGDKTAYQPFIFRRDKGMLILEADNATPVGRQVNRRIQIEFFYK